MGIASPECTSKHVCKTIFLSFDPTKDGFAWDLQKFVAKGFKAGF